jgi:hypothetical protein
MMFFAIYIKDPESAARINAQEFASSSFGRISGAKRRKPGFPLQSLTVFPLQSLAVFPLQSLARFPREPFPLL